VTDTDLAALGRLASHLERFEGSVLGIERQPANVTISWWSIGSGVSESDHVVGETMNEALAKALAALGDEGPCPVCGHPQEHPAADEICETCATRQTALRWERRLDAAMEAAR
jgi:hypothetical protein